MRWIWIDKFTEFESGKRAVSVKNVTLAEEHLHDHFPGYPTMPASLMVEAMAQTGGILVGEVRDFKEKVILAKVGKAVFTGKKMPRGWKGFTPEEAGYNAIKMMLYYMPLRYLSARQERNATKLYNVYGFGYPLGVDNKKMMWPEDIQ